MAFAGTALVQSLVVPKSNNTQSISSLEDGVMMKVKVPLLAAIHLYHTLFCSEFTPGDAKQVPVASFGLVPAPDTLVCVKVCLLHKKEAVPQS